MTDDNDHTPAFAQPQYAFTVKENVNVDHPIGTVLATDGDKDNNSRISYSISSGNTGTHGVYGTHKSSIFTSQ